MAVSIQQDSEFMINYMPANPIAAGKRFVAVQDDAGSPVVFSLGDDSSLSLIMMHNGVLHRWNFATLCNLPTRTKFSAFDVLQRADNSLSIVLATDEGVDKAGVGQNKLFVCARIMPSELAPDASKKMMYAGIYPVVYDIFLSNFCRSIGSDQLPMIFLALAPKGAVKDASQLGYLDIVAAPQGGSITFSLNTSWRLLTDPVKILGVAFGTSPLGQGAFVLYVGSDGNHLQFRTFAGNDFASEMTCPAGALSVDSYINPTTGYSELIVGGDAVTVFTFRQYCIGKSGVGTPIITRDVPLGCRDIHVSRATNALTVWCTTSTDAVLSYSALITSLTSGQLIPILCEGEGARISAILLSKVDGIVVEALLAVDQHGSLTLLQKPSDTGIWQALPYYLPSDADIVEIPSFTLRFGAVSTDPNQSVAGCQLHIKSSGAVEALVNGAGAIIDEGGDWFHADPGGAVNLIIRASDMASFTFQVDQFQAEGGRPIALGANVLNPNSKINTNLAQVTSGNSLLSAKTQKGEQLIAPGTISSKDADSAATTIIQLRELQENMARKAERRLKRAVGTNKLYNPRGERPKLLAGKFPTNPDEYQQLVQDLSTSSSFDPAAWWHWACEKAASALHYGLVIVGETVSFLIDFGKRTLNLLIDTVETVGKALSWVFETLAVGVEKLIDFVGFIFQWDDVLTTASSLVAVTNAALEYGIERIDKAKTSIPPMVELIKSKVKTKQPPIETATGTNTTHPQDDDHVEALKSSVAFNWVSNHVAHSGVITRGSIDDPKAQNQTRAHNLAASSMADIWKDVAAIVAVNEKLVADMGGDIRDFFTPTTKSTDIFARLTDQFCDAAVDTVGHLADCLLTALSLVLQKLHSLGNAKVNLPVFTPLWKQLTHTDLTTFNAFALLLAIPATVIFKVVKGRAPPDLRGMTPDLFGQYISGTSSTLHLKHRRPGSKRLRGGISFMRSEVTLFMGAAALLALHLEADFDALSWVAGKLSAVPAQTMDTAMIFMGVILLVASWPRETEKATGLTRTMRQISWGLDVSATTVLALGRFVGWTTGAPRETTAPIVATWGAFTACIGSLLGIFVIADMDRADIPLLVIHTVQGAFTVVKGVANGVQEVVEDVVVKGIAAIVKKGAVSGVVGFKLVEFWYGSDVGVGNRRVVFLMPAKL